MTATRILAAAALSACIAAPAFAQGAGPAPTDPTMPAPMDPTMTDRAKPPVAPPMSSDSLAATNQATDAAATAPNTTVRVVTNGPIPDTPENRAKYGKPDSNAGKRTKPAGN